MKVLKSSAEIDMFAYDRRRCMAHDFTINEPSLCETICFMGGYMLRGSQETLGDREAIMFAISASSD